MTSLNKVLIIIGAIITVGLFSIIVMQHYEMKTQTAAMQAQITAQKTLIDGITRSSSTYATKDDIATLLASNGVNAQALAAIQADMATVKATVTAANAIAVDSTGQDSTNQSSTSTGPKQPAPKPVTVACPSGGSVTCPTTDPYGYQITPQNFALNEEFGTLKVPFGTATFTASQPAPWSVDIPQREYDVSNIIGTDENQKITVYNKFSIKVNGQSYATPITTAATEQLYPAAKWSFFNPRLYLAIDAGINVTHPEAAVVPRVALQLMSYGKYKNQPDFSILQVGAGYNIVSKTPEVSITPFAFNLGGHIPLIQNLYIGPTLQYGTDGNFSVTGGLGAGL